jgi:uncharacterized protein
MTLFVTRYLRAAAILAIATAAFLPSTIAFASEPAFNCAKSDGQVQQLICSDEALAELDRQLADVYRTALEHLPPDTVPTVKAEQRGWIKRRDDCWKDEDPGQCVTAQYQTRIVQLQIASGRLRAPTAVGLDCDDKQEMSISAAFYNDTSPPAVVLTLGQDQVIAFVARSGSGARYTAPGVEYWEHQGLVSIDWFGTNLSCIVLN